MSLVWERLLGRSGGGRIDPHFAGTGCRLRQPSGESLGVRRVRLGENRRARRQALLGQPVVNVVRGQQAEPAVAVLGVVPGEEDLAVRAAILDRAKTLREVRPVLHGLELGFGEWVV